MTREERAAFFGNLPVAELADAPHTPIPLAPRTFPASSAMMIYPKRRSRLDVWLEQLASPIWRMLRIYGNQSRV